MPIAAIPLRGSASQWPSTLAAGSARAAGTAKRTERKHAVGTSLITGGSRDIVALLAKEHVENGHGVRFLASLLHGQEDVAAEQEQAGIEVVRGDIRAADA